MNDTVFGDAVSEEAFDDLTKLFNEVASEFRATIESANLDGQLYRDEKSITAALQQQPKLHFMITVTETGPDCRELAVGDTAILPSAGGTMVTVVDDVTNEPRRVFAISESVVLARWRAD